MVVRQKRENTLKYLIDNQNNQVVSSIGCLIVVSYCLSKTTSIRRLLLALPVFRPARSRTRCRSGGTLKKVFENSLNALVGLAAVLRDLPVCGAKSRAPSTPRGGGRPPA